MRNFLAARAGILAAFMLLLASGIPAEAQEPTASPTPAATTPPAPACAPVVFEGPGERTLLQVVAQLPAGSYGLSIPPPGAEPVFTLCHVQTGAVLSISGVDCREISRQAPNAAAAAVVDHIVASCRQAPPTPVATTTPPFSCALPPPVQTWEEVQGGRSVVIDGAISIHLPPGEFVIYVDDFGTASICNAEGGYQMSLFLGDCSRRDITPPQPFDVHREVTGQIQASCVVVDPTRAYPTPHPPVPTGGGAITPPSTGNAGLR
jgi:hypothetical protein